jgi:transposase, IS5 family
MIVDRYAPENLFVLVPQRWAEFEPELRELDRLLEDDQFFQQVKADLARRYRQSLRRGRHSTPVAVVLRLLVVRRLYSWSYEETEHFVADSLVLRQFCRVYLEAVPDDTTLIRWAHCVGAATLERLNDRVVELARSLKVTRGRQLRVDSTVVETSVHHPTDSSLLGDGVRVLSRLVQRAKAFVGDVGGLSQRVFQRHTRSMRGLLQQVHRLARRKGEEAAEQMQQAYRKLLDVAERTQVQAERVQQALAPRTDRGVQRLRQQFDHFLPLTQRVIQQATRRVLLGEQVPAKEKVLSLFEPHTQVIQRHKPGKTVAFGRKLWLDEVEGGIVSGWRVLPEAGPDHLHLEDSLTGHRQRFGGPPVVLAGDRGVFSPANERLAQAAGVKQVALPVAGKATAAQQQRERTRWFRRAFRFRAGIEGRISVLKRAYGLARCPEQGETGMEQWVGWGIITHNLVKIAEAVAGRRSLGGTAPA